MLQLQKVLEDAEAGFGGLFGVELHAHYVAAFDSRGEGPPYLVTAAVSSLSGARHEWVK